MAGPVPGLWRLEHPAGIRGRSGHAESRGAERTGYSGELTEVRNLDEIVLEETPRIGTGMGELDRVLGGGLVPGSAILIGGHPGAGKSTLLLQVMCRLADTESCLYVTGEESLSQVAMRADRLKLPKEKLRLAAETDVEQILDLARKERPRLLVVDSIQVMYLAGLQSAPGSVAQVRECAAALTRFAKQTGTVLLLVGHVTKDGTLAGPKVLEHMIDCSLMLEGSTDSRFRTLRGLKNRFGAVNELGVFGMTGEGLKEVKNPSAIFLNRADEIAAGSLVTVVWEGTRPLLVELQALVDASHFGNPGECAWAWKPTAWPCCWRCCTATAVSRWVTRTCSPTWWAASRWRKPPPTWPWCCPSCPASGTGPWAATWWCSARLACPARSARCPRARSGSMRR